MNARFLGAFLASALLIGGGFWLSQRQADPHFLLITQEPTEPVDETDEAPDATEAAAATNALDGFRAVPTLSDTPVQSFDAPESVLEHGHEYRALIQTNRGPLVVSLYGESAPITVNNFVFLALHRYYEGIVFHRVLDGFMAQTGDPTGTGRGGPGYQFEDEIDPDLSHEGPGVLSMANAGPGTNGSQFFITFAATPWLDGRHTVFGQVVEGLEILEELQRIDPTQPSAIVRPDDTLAGLAEQGVTLQGDEQATVETYLTESLGALPAPGSTFTIDGATGVYGSVGGQPAFGFYPRPDFITNVTIFTRAPHDETTDD